MSPQWKIAVFVLASAGFAWFTRSSLRDIRSHGFYRFFAWEAILALLLLNLEDWFEDLFSAGQLVSWFLLMAAALLALYATALLLRRGQPSQTRNDPALVGIEKTTRLVTTGVYRYIRHPQYCSLLLLTWGVLLKSLSPVTVGLALVATCFLVVTAKVEEVENIRFFGAPYEEYRQRTRMFIPYLF
jgi:protein-S-isoprenylcysteine O-methyltransferase Ste14